MVDIWNFTQHYTGPDYAWRVDENVTFTLSVDDYDQTLGNLTYYVFAAREDGTPFEGAACGDAPVYLRVDNSTCAKRFLFVGNATGGTPASPIPGRSSWVYGLSSSFFGSNHDEDWNLTLYMAAYNETSGKLGGASCGANLLVPYAKFVQYARNYSAYNETIRLAGHAECGDMLEPPSGVETLVVADFRGATGSRARVSWDVSPDAQNSSVEYWLFPREGLNAIGAFFQLSGGQWPSYLDGWSTPPGSSNRLWNVTGGEGTTEQWAFMVMVRDNLTHQRSELSCSALAQMGVVYSSDGCGSRGASSGDLEQGDPSFPGMDVPALATAIGVSTATLGLVLGALTILGAALTGYWHAKSVGAFMGTVLGVGLAAALNLFGLWVVVVIFLLAVTAIVLKLNGGGGGE